MKYGTFLLACLFLIAGCLSMAPATDNYEWRADETIRAVKALVDDPLFKTIKQQAKYDKSTVSLKRYTQGGKYLYTATPSNIEFFDFDNVTAAAFAITFSREDAGINGLYIHCSNIDICIIGGNEKASDFSQWFFIDLNNVAASMAKDPLQLEGNIKPLWVSDKSFAYVSTNNNTSLTSSGLAGSIVEQNYLSGEINVIYEANSDIAEVYLIPTDNNDPLYMYQTRYIEVHGTNKRTISTYTNLKNKSDRFYHSSGSVYFNGSLVFIAFESFADDSGSYKQGDVVTVRGGIFNLLYRPPLDEYVQKLSVTKDYLIISSLKNMSVLVRKLSLNNSTPVSTVFSRASKSNVSIESYSPTSNVINLIDESYLKPKTRTQYNLDANSKTVLNSADPQFDSSGLVEELHFAVSADGTKVPYHIVYPKGLKATPGMLYANGGFGIHVMPKYKPSLGKLWLEKNRAYILAHIRGGQEYGIDWWKDSLTVKKINSINDLAAIADDAVEKGFVVKGKLFIRSGLISGITTVGAVALKPELFGGITVLNGILNVESLSKYREGSTFFYELGDSRVEKLSLMRKMSPFHMITANTLPPFFLKASSGYSHAPPEYHSAAVFQKIRANGNENYYMEFDVKDKLWRTDRKLLDYAQYADYVFFEKLLK
jgi:prolyl oligopeptidase PreP (S9A serine peptidase family)